MVGLTSKERRRLIRLELGRMGVTLLLILAVVALWMDTKAGQHRVDVEQCRKENVLGGYLILRAESLAGGKDPNGQLAPAFFALRNCDATIDAEGRDVLLAPEEQEKYLQLLRECRFPMVRGGRVVDSAAFSGPCPSS